VHGEREAAHHISIGRFAGLTGISANTLRRYDEAGLLSPAFADPLTGYRQYSIEQLDDGILLRLLRDLDVPLDEVKSLMVAGGPDGVRAALAHHRKRIVERHVELERILARIDAAFEEERGLLPYELELVELRPQRVVSCRTTARPRTPRRVTW
jgi:DNA-binding transcriptional MerR regulator